MSKKTKRFHPVKWMALCVTVIVCLTMLGSYRMARAGELDDKLREMEELQKEIDEYKAQINSKKKTENSLLKELERLEDQLNLSEKELAYIRARISYIDAQIGETKKQIESIEKKMNAQRSAFNARIVSMYKSRMVSYIDILLTSRSLSDFLARMYYLREIAAQDVQLIDEYAAQREDLISRKEALEKSMAELAALKQSEERKRQEAASRRLDRERYLTRIQSERKELERALDEMEKESKALEQVIRDLQAKSGRAKNETLSFIWPCSGGWISSYYGYRMHPILGYRRFHSGIDYAANRGTPIKAVEDGTVILAGTNGGYGYCVIIDHGGGISTLYAHAEKLLVKKGQEVSKGQTIALVGSTGMSTGPHLHFEVRINGATEDPLKWLPKR